MKTDRWAYENLEVYVWEGKYEIADRVTRFRCAVGHAHRGPGARLDGRRSEPVRRGDIARVIAPL